MYAIMVTVFATTPTLCNAHDGGDATSHIISIIHNQQQDGNTRSHGRRQLHDNDDPSKGVTLHNNVHLHVRPQGAV